MVKVAVVTNGQIIFCTASSLSGSCLVTPFKQRCLYRLCLRQLHVCLLEMNFSVQDCKQVSSLTCWMEVLDMVYRRLQKATVR